jgi:hypothetical protein
MVPVIGTVVEVGPDEAAPEDTTFSHIVIRQKDGRLREFAMVRAIYEVAGLVEAKGGGTFVFLNVPPECRLAFVYRDTGARTVDFDAMLYYFDQA